MKLDFFSAVTSVGAIADWIVTAIFIRAVWTTPRPTWLAERALRSMTLAVAVTLFAFIALGDLNGLDEQAVRAFGSIAVAVVSVYPIGLLAWYVHWRRQQK
jgi:hypothetical protein